LLRLLFQFCGHGPLAAEARIVRVLLFYFDFVPTLAIYVTFIGSLWLFPEGRLSDLPRLWWLVPLPGRLAMLGPVLAGFLLLWTARRTVANSPDELWKSNAQSTSRGPWNHDPRQLPSTMG